ncbi:MAG: HYR domain-containing protein [Saprospirales bacterium]|nr:HYR domain-containing protein [Saprospirales bacterium]
MKKLLIFLAAFFLAQVTYAQCICQMSFVETTDCCYEMYYTLDNDASGIACTAMGYNQVTINTDWIPAQGSEVVSVNLTNPNLTATINGANNIVTINSSGPLVTPVTLGAPVLMGIICLSNGPQPPVDAYFQANFTNSSIPAANPCTYNFTKNLACAIPGEWTALCGNDSTSAKTVNRIHAFNDGVYVTSVKGNFGSEVRATFSKYDINDGTLVWQKVMSEPTFFTDFAYIQEEDAFICVGRTDPFQTPSGFENNKSVIVKFDDQGNILASKFYQQEGREGFSQILRHSNPPNPNFPFYILGTKNPDPSPVYPPSPSYWDDPVVFNIDADLNVNWVRDYITPLPSIEWEGSRGFFEHGQGVVFTGNDIPDNNGLLVPVNGLNGVPGIVRLYNSSDFDLYEGVVLPSGQIALAGTDFSAGEAIVMLLDNVHVPIFALRYPDIKEFREIGLDADGRIYAVGPLKSGGDFYVINRIIHTGSSLQHDISAYLNEGGSPLELGHFDVTPDLNGIFYAQGIKGSPNATFGTFGTVVSSLDLDLSNNPCLISYPQSPVAFTPQSFPLEINSNLLPEPPFISVMDVFDLPFSCDAICGSCGLTAFFDFQVNCFTVDFTDQSSGVAPFTYAWDFDCDGNVDATSANPTWVLPDILAHQVCLTVTDADGCIDTYMAMVQAVDSSPPVVTCTDLILPTDPGECFATLSGTYITYSDNCFPNSALTISCTLGGDPLPASLPKGVNYLVTCTVVDPFGNEGECEFFLTVEDAEPPVVMCPNSIVVDVPACVGQATLFLDQPTFTDNCPMGSASCSLEGEVTFTCGPPILIECVATDMSGNTDVCNYTVTVNCTCVEPMDFIIECTPDPDVFMYSISLNNLTGQANPDPDCMISVATSTSNVLIQSQATSWVGNIGTVSGVLRLPALRFLPRLPLK